MAKLQIKDKNGNFLKLDDRKEKMAKGILIHNGSVTFKAEKLAESGGAGSITLEKDYMAIVITTSVDGKRTQAGLPSFNVNGLQQLAGASTGNWGYNGSIGKDNDFVTATNVYGSAEKGHSISWSGASNGWGHILVLGITR
mgnify:FL=1